MDVGEDQRKQAAENDQVLTEAALSESEFAAQMWDGSPSQARAALGSVVDRVVIADRRLAGWYNIQIGHTLELEGDTESAAKQYSQARSRIQHLLSLPLPITSQSIAKKQEPKNLFHSRLLEIFENDIRIQNDAISRYERMILPLFDSAASAAEHEEALRHFGELLGFESSRPEQEDDNDSTLDVLWRLPSLLQAILFELKSKKKTGQAINREDVGQGFNHIQWASTTFPNIKVLGLIFVSVAEICTKEASPSDQMWVVQIAKIRELYEETIQMLLALQRMQPLERYAEIEALVLRAEWQPEGIFKRIRGKHLPDVKMSS